MSRRIAFSFVLVGALAVGRPAFGQRLETLTVRASRTPTSIESAGSSVSVITREQIERRQPMFVADLLRAVPGIAVSRSGTLGAQTQLRVRGSEANQVLVFIDGIEVNDPAVGDEFQFEHLLSAGVERIEIVRGPQSALWGSDAVGGVINIETRAPEGRRARRASLEAGSFATVSARARAALGRDGRRFEIGAAYLDTDGTNVARSGEEEDGYRNAGLDLSAHLRPHQAVRVDVVAHRFDTRQEFDATDFATGLPADADRAIDGQRSYAAATASIDGDTRFSHRVAITYLDTANRSSADGAPAGSTSAEKAGLYYQGRVAMPGSGQGLTLALEHESERFGQRGEAGPFGDPNQRQRLATTGYAVEYRNEIGSVLNLSASARYDSSNEFDDVATYRVTASYALGERTRVRASYGTGQKSPTFIDRFGFFADQFIGNPDLEPERSKGWEIGMRRTSGEGRVSFDVAYFQDRLDDEIDGFVFDPASGRFTAVNRAGRSHRRGFEAQVSAEVSDALDLAAAYAYLDATQPDGAGGQEREIRRPRHTASLNANYAFSDRASMNVDLSYNGARYDTFFSPSGPAERLELGSYRLVTIAGRLELTERLELFGRVENLLDEDYEDVLGFATPGIGAYIGVRADLGRGD